MNTTLGAHLEASHWSRPTEFTVLDLDDDHASLEDICALASPHDVTDLTTFAVYPHRKAWRRSRSSPWRAGTFSHAWMQLTGRIVSAVPHMQEIRRFLLEHSGLTLEQCAQLWAATRDTRPTV